MIDVTDHGYLMKDSCTGSPPVDRIQELATMGDSVAGISASGPFVFDLATGSLKLYTTRAEALAQFTPPPTLLSADAFYRQRRFGWQDLTALAVLLLAVAVVSLTWFTLFIRPRRVALT
jgi:drug/metabolite transporter (DMT)-like permease